jgi:hypothetical protein
MIPICFNNSRTESRAILKEFFDASYILRYSATPELLQLLIRALTTDN